MSLKNVLARAEKPVLYVTLGALLLLGIKNCSDGDVVRETNENVKKVLADTDSLKNDTDTIKAFSKATHTVVQRTESKVDFLQETEASILQKLDSCCDCDKQREQKQSKPAPKKKKPVVKPKKNPVKPEPCPRDTVVVVVRDTVCVTPGMPNTPKAVLDCYLPVRTR